MEGTAAPKPGPVFVVGSMRSGSTMLRLILDSHPHIAIGGETGFMGALLATKRIPDFKFGSEWYERLNWTEQELDERLREFYGGMFSRHAEQQGKQRWGEKTPFHTAHMAEMASVFPDAIFVGIVRHPGAVATSLRKFHYSFPDGLAYWAATNLDLVRAGADLGDRFALCRYEDLVLDGEPVLRELMSFLDEPWHQDLLEHHRVQREKGAPRVVEGSTVTHDPIDATRAAQWANGASADDLDALESTAGLAGFFGYDPVHPTPRQSLTLAARPDTWTVSGRDLALRRRDWNGRVDFEMRLPSGVLDASPEELAARLARVEGALARTRSRKAVRIADALRKVQHGRSMGDIGAALSLLRGSRGAGERTDGF